MVDNLKMLLKNSYTPLSGFAVASILVCKNNQEFVGVNVENPSYKSGLCAEQVSIASAISEGYKKEDFKELHIMGSGDNICMPCFLCRQLIFEFFEENLKVICYNKRGKKKEFTVSQLCPYGFVLEDSNGK